MNQVDRRYINIRPAICRPLSNLSTKNTRNGDLRGAEIGFIPRRNLVTTTYRHDDYSSTSALVTFRTSSFHPANRTQGAEPESDWKTLLLSIPPSPLGICNSIVRESRNLPLPHDETKLTSQISRISFECYRTASIPLRLANFRTNEGEFVAAEMRMSEVSLRVIGSFARFARDGKGNGTRLKSRGIEIKNSKMDGDCMWRIVCMRQ